jgi:hypothetical protein
VLALGSGLNTSVLAVAYGVLVRPLPYSDPSRLVVVQAGGSTEDPDGGIPLAAVPDWQTRLRTVDRLRCVAIGAEREHSSW